jgi:hypothetical protein
MKSLRIIFSYIKKYPKLVAGYFSLNILSAAFSLISLTMLTPFLTLIFGLQDQNGFKTSNFNLGPLTNSLYDTLEQLTQSTEGKIKALGSVGVTYYGSIDDKAYSGKIKSLGSNNYVYYSSFEQQYLKGALKSGNMIQVINGITFYIR